MATTTYCTNQQVQDSYGAKYIAQLTGDPQGDLVASTVVDDAIARAAGRMNSHIRVVYPDLPFDETHDLLRDLNIEGAYLILQRESPNGWSDEEQKQWSAWLKQLRDIGDEHVDLRTETDAQEEDEVDAKFSANTRRFGRQFLDTTIEEGNSY